ncbi:MAG: hypothetical protein M3P24_01475 [Gemmatimonadota bacterium]|nr:hypothetical protein [Gemmatimonadota bacterium]
MTSFQTYLLGFIVLVIGLAGAAHLAGVPSEWIVVGAIVLVGIGILTATTRTKPRDPHHPLNDPRRPQPPRGGTGSTMYDDTTRPY